MNPHPASQVETVIEARIRGLGGLKIRRLLPSRRRQRIGPFIFLDHIGPESLPAGRGVDVPPHPHIDLATVTYLFEGDLVHRDSLGSVETIRPGEINWMHAGRGVVHSERTGPELRKKASRIHGLQMWAALPAESEGTPPHFKHYSSDSLPVVDDGGTTARVLVGEALGRRSPVRTTSITLCVDVIMQSGARFRIPDSRERGIYIVEGAVSVADTGRFEDGSLVVLGEDPAVFVEATVPARFVVLGGAPIEGERRMWWNFVSSSPERIERAKRDWGEGRFPRVPGDDERIPLPA